MDLEDDISPWSQPAYLSLITVICKYNKCCNNSKNYHGVCNY